MSDMGGDDYVAVAKFRLEGVHDQQSHEGMTDATMIAAALDAQAQATLALAFEQRTANMIALLDHTRTHDSVTALKEVVWERLGLVERKATK